MRGEEISGERRGGCVERRGEKRRTPTRTIHRPGAVLRLCCGHVLQHAMKRDGRVWSGMEGRARGWKGTEGGDGRRRTGMEGDESMHLQQDAEVVDGDQGVHVVGAEGVAAGLHALLE